jgi:hypothetical protein
MALVTTPFPISGKAGGYVFSPGRYGETLRGLPTKSTKPPTEDQLTVRQNLSASAQAYDALTEVQQNAWITAAAGYTSRTRMGHTGPLTGLQLFTKVNSVLRLLGDPPVTTPPATPAFAALPISGLEITNPGGVVAIKLVTTGSPPDGTMLRGCPPANSGVRRVSGERFLGILDSPVGARIAITSAYTGKFGAPAVGQRVFVRVNPSSSGLEGPSLVFSALVPAAT